MRILLLSWEYPPHVVGGLGRHVGALARSLAIEGHEVHVVTRDLPDAPEVRDAFEDGVHVVRVPEAPPVIGFDQLVSWVLAFNNRIQAVAGRLLREREFDVIHAHDWLVAYAAAGLKETWDVPVVATIHATESGRHQGWLPGPMNELIHQVEWWLTYEARRVIVCSTYMRAELERIFALPGEKIDVVPNGVDVDDFAVDATEAAETRSASTGPRTRMILYAGRLEYEKGVQTLLAALQDVRRRCGPTRLFVAGSVPTPTSCGARCGGSGSAGMSGSPASSPTGISACISAPRTSPSCHRSTNPSDWSPSRRWRAAPRSWWATPAASARSSRTAPGCPSHPRTPTRSPTRSCGY